MGRDAELEGDAFLKEMADAEIELEEDEEGEEFNEDDFKRFQEQMVEEVGGAGAV